jgi:hypothetical protein
VKIRCPACNHTLFTTDQGMYRDCPHRFVRSPGDPPLYCTLHDGHGGPCLFPTEQPTQAVPEKAPETPDDAKRCVCGHQHRFDRCALCMCSEWRSADPFRTEAGTADDGVR